mmetsp:Transcript_106950/g.190138  ORF Transcript_106950/g.190138 Transcript_106950/m.190138 type:complete len:200 (-) Transcript_106950:87-686(-)
MRSRLLQLLQQLPWRSLRKPRQHQQRLEKMRTSKQQSMNGARRGSLRLRSGPHLLLHRCLCLDLLAVLGQLSALVQRQPRRDQGALLELKRPAATSAFARSTHRVHCDCHQMKRLKLHGLPRLQRLQQQLLWLRQLRKRRGYSAATPAWGNTGRRLLIEDNVKQSFSGCEVQCLKERAIHPMQLQRAMAMLLALELRRM